MGMTRGAPEQATLMVEDAASGTNIEEHLDLDTLVPGHPPLPEAQADVAEMRQYLEGLIAAGGAAQEQALTNNSPESKG